MHSSKILDWVLAPVRECISLAGLAVHHGAFGSGGGHTTAQAARKHGRERSGGSAHLQNIELPSAPSTGA